jgi:hypothetical protein
VVVGGQERERERGYVMTTMICCEEEEESGDRSMPVGEISQKKKKNAAV